MEKKKSYLNWKRSRPLSHPAAPPVGPVDSVPAEPVCSAEAPALRPPSHSRPPESAAGGLTLKNAAGSAATQSRGLCVSFWTHRGETGGGTRRRGGLLASVRGVPENLEHLQTDGVIRRPLSVQIAAGGEEEEKGVQAVPCIGGFRVSDKSVRSELNSHWAGKWGLQIKIWNKTEPEHKAAEREKKYFCIVEVKPEKKWLLLPWCDKEV